MTFNPNMAHMGDRPLKVGDVVKPNSGVRTAKVARIDARYAYLDFGQRTTTRVQLRSIHTDGKPRRTGYSLVVEG